MDIDIREILKKEMTKCNSFRLFKNRVRKVNNILPDDVVENILSFVQCSCKKCVKTREVVEDICPYEQELYDRLNREDDKYLQDNLKLWSCCFQNLNIFPTEKAFFKRFQNATRKDYSYCIMLKMYPYEIPWATHKEIYSFKKPICREFMIWLLCERGCRFYPEVFNEKFQSEVIRYMFD